MSIDIEGELTPDEVLGAFAYLTALHHEDWDAARIFEDDMPALIRGLSGVFFDLAEAVAAVQNETVCDLLNRARSAHMAYLYDRGDPT